MTDIARSNDFAAPSDDSEGPLGIYCLNSTDILTIQSMGKINIEAREFIDFDQRDMSYTVRVTLTSSGDYPSESTAVIKLEEIENVTRAIERLAKADPSITKFRRFEARFDSNDKLNVAVFVGRNDNLMGAVSHGSSTVILTSIAELEKFNSALQRAKSYIDSNRIVLP